jgi:hypothetical protein
VAATSWAFVSDEAAGGQIRLRQFPGVQYEVLFTVRPIELGFPKFQAILTRGNAFEAFVFAGDTRTFR